MFIESLCLHPPPALPHPAQEAMVIPGSPGESHHSAFLQPPPHSSHLCQSMLLPPPPTSGAGWVSIHKAPPTSKC